MDPDLETWKETIPKHWEVKRLGDVCKFLGGGTPSKQELKYWNGGIHWATIKDIKGKYLENTIDFISDEGLRKSATNLAICGDLILATRINPGKPIITKIDSAINQDLKIVKPLKDISIAFLYYFFLNSEKLVLKLSSGTTVLGINLNNLNNLPIPIPPLAEQQTIVAKIEELFSELEKGKEQLETALAQLKVYRQSLLQSAFSGKLTNIKIESVKLSEHASLITKGASPKWQGFDYVNDESQLLFVTSENVRENYLDVSKPKFLNLEFNNIQKRSILQHGDVLFNLVGASIGRATIFNSDRIANINQAVALIRLKQSLNNKYVTYFLNSELAKQKYLSNVVDFARANLSLTDTSNIDVPYCSIIEQSRIVDELDSKLSVCDQIEETIKQSLAQAEVLRQSILKQAFEGKLVPHIQTEIGNVATEKVDTTDQEKTKITFHDIQMVAFVLSQAEKSEIQLAEMTLAKYLYLLQTIYKIQLNLKFKRWHLGPYAPEIKKIINNRTYFKLDKNAIKILNKDKLTKYNFNDKEEVERSMNSLAKIFSYYSVKDRSRKTELLATLCRVIEEIKSMDFESVRKSMQDWPIELDSSNFKNKAQKFSEDETKKCLAFIQKQGWDQILLTQ